MPRYLTDQDIADFRAELCKVATERFARFGYEGVTMRQLADALGCSPKTPYRYFKDKADILATVRAQAFEKFSDALQAAVTGASGDPVSKAQAFEKFSDALQAAVTNASGDPVSRAQAVGEAYYRFAMKNPHAYRIMFDIEAPIDDNHPELGPKARHAATFITNTAEGLAKAGLIDVDPKLFGWSMWAASHGLVMLKQAGMLHDLDYRTLAQFHGAVMLRGAAPAKKAGKKR